MKFTIQAYSEMLILQALPEGNRLSSMIDGKMVEVEYPVIEMSLDEAKEVCDKWEGSSRIIVSLGDKDIDLFSKS